MGTGDQYVEANGLRFHILELGSESDPPLVFLHGVLAAAQTYVVVLEGLARHRRVIAIDQRGHGRTTHAADYAWERWVEDVHAVCGLIGIERTDLVGHSMGAHNAARFAGEHPEMVDHLVLVEGGFGPFTSSEQEGYWTAVASLFPADGHASRAAYTASVLEAFPRADEETVGRSAQNLVERPDGRWEWPDAADLAVLGAEGADPTPEAELGFRTAFGGPTLVIRAEHSELFVGDAYRTVAGQYPRGTADALPGAGHMVMWENVPGLIDLIDRFLARPAGP